MKNSTGRCWICESKRSTEFLPSTIGSPVTCEDFKITDSHYGRTARLVICNICGFVYAHPLPSEDILGIYVDLKDDEYDESGVARIRPFYKILKTIRALRPKSRTLLDIGAGVGLLCKTALDFGFQVRGIEPSRWAVNLAYDKYNLDLICGTFPHKDIENKKFDIITLIDVIEHVTNPLQLLMDIQEALTPNGLAVIVSPDINSIAARLLRRKWWHFRVAHLCFFSQKTMELALSKAGLKLIAKEKYRWWFPLSYVLERLENYLPIKRLNKMLQETYLNSKLQKINIPLNLHDSIIYYVTLSWSEGKEGEIIESWTI